MYGLLSFLIFLDFNQSHISYQGDGEFSSRHAQPNGIIHNAGVS